MRKQIMIILGLAIPHNDINKVLLNFIKTFIFKIQYISLLPIQYMGGLT